jgi:hypothetical protein
LIYAPFLLPQWLGFGLSGWALFFSSAPEKLVEMGDSIPSNTTLEHFFHGGPYKLYGFL